MTPAFDGPSAVAGGPPWAEVIHGMRRLVVKVGTSTLTGGGVRLDAARLYDIVRQLIDLHRRGLDVILVTSGAIVTGAARLNLQPAQRSIPERQALAAIGQAMLMHEYESRFAAGGVVVAQLLLTAGDFDQRSAFLNARNTVVELLRHRVVPIVNENDTIATDEIRIGDNDTLSARVAALVNAELLCILSDVDGLYTSDPRSDPAAQRLDTVDRLTPEIEMFARRTSSVTGVGGMVTKVKAARMATAAGTAVAIVDGGIPNVILRVLEGEPLGTRFLPWREPLRGRQRWLSVRTRVRGRLRIDPGAAEAILSQGRSLLPGGILEVEGDFTAGDLVAILGPDGVELGRGIAACGRQDLERIKGRNTHEATAILGATVVEAIHRHNMVIHR